MIEESDQPSLSLRITFYASYGVVLGMLICLAFVAIQFIQWLSPTWQSGGIIVFCALAAIEAVASRHLINQLHTAQHQMAFYRITEWLIISLILKLFVELSLGPASFWQNFNLWLVDFPMNIFNGRFWLALFPIALIWAIANLFDDDLSQLGNLENILKEEVVRTTTVRNLIIRRFLNVGLFVVVLAGVPPQTLISGPMPPASNSVPAVVMYFVLGVILLSLTRFNYLSTMWHKDRLKVPGVVPRRWLIYTAVIIACLAALILLLPSQYGLGLLDMLSALLSLLIKIGSFIYFLIYLAINFIWQLFFPHRGQVLPEPIVPAATPPPVDLSQVTGPSPIWKLIQSILFWGVLGVLVIIALRQYILFHKDLADELKKFRPLRWLVLFWKRVTASVRKANKSVGIFVQSSLKRLRNIGKAPVSQDEWDYINPRRLNDRQKVIFFYLALLRRAGDAGLPRRDGQTPYEYSHTLSPNLTEGKEAVEALTNSFVEARYSRHDIPREEARRMESIWEVVRRLLRNLRKSRQEKDRSD